VAVRFILHLQTLRGEGFGQLPCDNIGGSHALALGKPPLPVNAVVCGAIEFAPNCQVLKASCAKAHSVRS
jgi:hypothetical protein